MSEAPERTALYRIRGEENVLLYIGITNGIPVRWNGHQAVQPWWDEVRSMTFEWCETRAEAEAAEKAAIPAEQPKYNVTYLRPGRGRPGGRPEPVPVDWESVTLELRDDDEDLLSIDDITDMLRLPSSTSALNALKRTGGPAGFALIKHQLFRRGEIRRWIAAVEASSRGAANDPSAPSAGQAGMDAA